jgi:hypothetical protein
LLEAYIEIKAVQSLVDEFENRVSELTNKVYDDKDLLHRIVGKKINPSLFLKVAENGGFIGKNSILSLYAEFDADVEKAFEYRKSPSD